jgi:hypothetical protein
MNNEKAGIIYSEMNYKVERIENAFRYLVTGSWVYMILWLCYNCMFDRIHKEVGTSLLIVSTFVIGASFYFIYRSLIYPRILRIVDSYQKENPRNYLLSKFKNDSFDKAHDIWKKAYSETPNIDRDRYEIWYASIHMMNMMAIICLMGIPLLVIGGFNWYKLGILIILFVLLIFSAFESDKDLQRRLHMEIANIDDSNLKNIIDKVNNAKKKGK